MKIKGEKSSVSTPLPTTQNPFFDFQRDRSAPWMRGPMMFFDTPSGANAGSEVVTNTPVPEVNSPERIAKALEILKQFEDKEIVRRSELEIELFDKFEKETKALKDELAQLKATRATELETMALRLVSVMGAVQKFGLNIITEGRSDVQKMMLEVMSSLRDRFAGITLEYDTNASSIDTHFANFVKEAERFLMEENTLKAQSAAVGSVQVII